jgi:UDP-N-acetylmuramoyl-L-alanyl-D-glutamate--2,6-diaminopimelate ligase
VTPARVTVEPALEPAAGPAAGSVVDARGLGCQPVPSSAGVPSTGSVTTTEPAPPRPRTTPGTTLSELARRVRSPGGLIETAPTEPAPTEPALTDRRGDVRIDGVTLSSRRVRPGDLFAALPGAHAHGARFAAAARRAGAVAVLTDRAGADLIAADADLIVADADPVTADADLIPPGPPGREVDQPVLVVADPRAALGPIASAVYGDPSRRLAVAGVTGTSGKTTTTFLIRAGLRAAGRMAGLIGTVGAFIGDEPVPGGLTTPEAPDLQALLAVMAERGITDTAMEVSSHALALDRVGGTTFAVAAFTNLSQDHLEFHADMRDYFEAKARLFDGRAAHHVVVVDDEWGRELTERLGPTTVSVSTSGPATSTATDSTATWTAADIVTAADGRTRFRAIGPAGPVEAGCAIAGRYNVANVLLALAVLDALGVAPDVAAPAVAAAQVPGRMERIETGQNFLAVVDYAHKPAAVDGALRALRPLTDGRLIVVLGCGGDRDRDKRPVMGRVAAEQADVLIVTDDNPRSEDASAIRRAVLDGARGARAVSGGAQVSEIGDRADAIAAAVAMARAGDTVLVAGKGHETGQYVGGVVHPFDDRQVLRDLLANR